MGGLSITHILILAIILIVLFAPRRISQAGQSVGEAIRGFKKGLNGDEIDVTPKIDASTVDPITQKSKDKSHQDS